MINGGPEPIEVVLAVAGVILLFFAPDIMINSRAHDRQQAILHSLPDTLDQMTIAVEAGLGFDSAMAKAARGGEGPLAKELIRVLQDMSIGRTRRNFEELARRTSSEDLDVSYCDHAGRRLRCCDRRGPAGAGRRDAHEAPPARRGAGAEGDREDIFPLIFCLLPAMFIVILTPAVIGIMEQFGG